MTSKVLIIGAGPVGLTAALELQKYGVAFDIIDKRSHRGSQSKALSVSAASLKVFYGLGLWPRFQNIGQRIQDIFIYFNGRRCGHIDKRCLGAPFDFYLSLPQPETERILEDRLEELGATVRYMQECRAIVQTDAGVEVSITDSANERTAATVYSHVVACDGAQGLAAGALGLEFVHHDYKRHFVMGDVRFDRTPKNHTTTYYALDDGFMIYLPMADGLTRLVISRPGPLPAGSANPSRDDLQAAVERYLPELIGIVDVTWRSSARFFSRVAKSNTVGRIYLAGDAWHLFSPIGGQGMNTGLQDALNLGWKLAYTLKGYAKPSLLESYRQERLLAVQRTSESIHRNTLQLLRDVKIDAASDLYVPAFGKRWWYRKYLPQEFGGYLADYCEDAATLVGKHVPYGQIVSDQPAPATTYDLPSLGCNVVLTSNPLLAAATERVLANFRDVIRIFDLSRTAPDCVLALHLSDDQVCLVRPDGYVGFIGPISELSIYLDSYYHQTTDTQAPVSACAKGEKLLARGRFKLEIGSGCRRPAL